MRGKDSLDQLPEADGNGFQQFQGGAIASILRNEDEKLGASRSDGLDIANGYCLLMSGLSGWSLGAIASVFGGVLPERRLDE